MAMARFSYAEEAFTSIIMSFFYLVEYQCIYGTTVYEMQKQ